MSNQSIEDIRLRPLSLRFYGKQADLETVYSDFYFNKNLTHFRYCHYISVLFYLMAAVIDYALFPSLYLKFWGIRFGIVAPCFMTGLMLTYRPIYRHIWRQLSFFYILLTGFSFIFMMVVSPAPDSYTYYIGIMICMIFGYTFIREPFIWATSAGCTLLVSYFIVAQIIEMPYRSMLIYGFYLAVVNTLGMLIARSFEIRSRKDFHRAHLLQCEKKKVNRLTANLEFKVRSRTQDLIRTNEELAREIGERQLIEDKLRISQQRYRSLQSNIPIGLYRISKGEVLAANPAMLDIFKAENEQMLLSRPVVDYFNAPADMDTLLDQLREKECIINTEVQFMRTDGSSFWGLINVVRVQPDNQYAAYYDGTLEDITARKAIAQEKETLELQLRQARKMESLGTLAGGIAHDFNNILTIAMGFTEMALEDVDSKTLLGQNLLEVNNAAQRAKELVKQILTFARKSDEVKTPVQVGKIAEESIRFLRSTIPSSIRIDSRITSNATVMGNATQIHQILMNLCTNAAHAMEDTEGVIHLRVKDIDDSTEHVITGINSPSGRFIEIRVSDTGKGIAPENLNRVFDPYFTTKGPGEGTGMGLAVVHGIIESHGGKISVESEPGNGTTFMIHLPTARSKDHDKPFRSDSLPTGNERILFVDDETTIATVASLTLRRLGYQVETRTDSLEALELFRSRSHDFDLVITDMTMPNMTGDRLAAALIDIRSDIPIILCTGYSKRISQDDVAAIGIKAFTLKPFARADLANTVRRVLDEAQSAATTPPKQTEPSGIQSPGVKA